MKKQLLALAGLALFFAACSSKKDDPQPEPEKPKSLSGMLKTVYTLGGNDTSHVFYNDDITLRTVKSDWNRNTSDTGGNIDSVAYADGKPSGIWEKYYNKALPYNDYALVIRYAYANNKLQKVIIPPQDNYSGYDSIGYNASGKAEKAFRYVSMDGTAPKEVARRTFTWTGNNVTKVVYETMENGKVLATSEDNYTYDDKPNWRLDVSVITQGGGLVPEAVNANNILKQTRTASGIPAKTNSFTYQYDDKNKVVKVEATYEFDMNPGLRTTVIEYYK
ncbi:hypothetical protein [Chitinophaga qingshengii]|uniref:DUF4595 domain-containing protein n=1 Tax=Chitinophaga qingshengii TaxID=1569794 RepID=A0ABR7TNS8_9BACT|nr:hypothetical protein [Chitinophaga qingshengii]MBC9932136.1 hypothetical protein [Chitinophaga qingshengii]